MGSRNRRRIPIPFGQGLDRETGIMAAPPTSMADLRNVFLHQGKFLVRRGFEVRVELNDGTNDMTDVIGGHALRSLRNSVYVGYDSTTGNVQVFRGDSFGGAATFIGTWFTLTPGSAPPVISMAESYGKVFMAHDDPIIATRAKTIYYDSSTDTIADLTQDWDGSGPYNIKFRGVERHLNYLWGWGYGTETTASGVEDRPEMVRVSRPAAPTDFDINWYFVVGDRDDPVIRCIPAGGTLLAFKESETWELFGYSRDNFGQRPLDPLYGLGVSRLAVNVSGRVFAWTNEGPRLYDGSFGSEPLELPLELPQPEPDDLVPEGDLRLGFAEYLPYYRVVLFFFGKRVYALTVRVEGDWKWSYWELGFEPLCGFRLPVTAGGIAPPPDGFADNLSVSSITDTGFTLGWDNNSQVGTETLEVWAQEATAAGPWTQVASFAVSASGSQTGDVTGISPGLDHNIAVRYRRGVEYNPDYASSDPSSWPAGAQTTVTTTLSAPAAPTGDWERVDASTEKFTLTVTPLHSGVNMQLLDASLAVLATEVGPDGTFTFETTAVTGEAINTFYVRHQTTDVDGDNSAGLGIWGGPQDPPVITSLNSSIPDGYNVALTAGNSSQGIYVYDDWTRPSGPQDLSFDIDAATPVATLSPPTVSASETLSGATGVTLNVFARHFVVTDGVEDYSQADTDTVEITA